MRTGVIELYIDELVLEGFETTSRRTVGEALQGRLAELFSQQPLAFTSDVSIGELSGSPLTLTPRPAPHELGAAIADSVHSGLTR